jgi:hypothetical protein
MPPLPACRTLPALPDVPAARVPAWPVPAAPLRVAGPVARVGPGVAPPQAWRMNSKRRRATQHRLEPESA